MVEKIKRRLFGTAIGDAQVTELLETREYLGHFFGRGQGRFGQIHLSKGGGKGKGNLAVLSA